MSTPSLKKCPLCGETILAVAIRCKHCQADLSAVPEAIGPPPVVDTPDFAMLLADSPIAEPTDFERRFLEFAYTTHAPINAPAVAFALKVSIAEATDQLDDLAARDVLLREVDDIGQVSYKLPGRTANLLARGMKVSDSAGAELMLRTQPGQLTGPLPPPDGQAVAALLLNVLLLPGFGSLIGGQVSTGVAQMVMFLVGIPLCFVLVGIPMVFAAWVWSLVTGVQMVTNSRMQQLQPPSL